MYGALAFRSSMLASVCVHLIDTGSGVFVRFLYTKMVGNDVCEQLDCCRVCDVLHHLQGGRILNELAKLV